MSNFLTFYGKKFRIIEHPKDLQVYWVRFNMLTLFWKAQTRSGILEEGGVEKQLLPRDFETIFEHEDVVPQKSDQKKKISYM